MNNKYRLEKLFLTLFSFITTAFLGWHIFSVISIFFQLNQNRIQFSFQQWMPVQTIYLPAVSVVLILLGILLITQKLINQKKYALNYNSFKWLLIALSTLFFFALLNYILTYYQLHQNIFELMVLIFAIISLYHLGKLFYIREKSVWYHPTTQGSFYISTALLGISQMLIFGTLNSPFTNYAFFLLVLLIFEIFRIVSRFKYLTKFSSDTNMLARLLLGRYGIYFGVRVVAGIFMPIVYIIYALYVNDYLFQGVGALLIIGEFIERLLFVYLSDISINNIKTKT